MSRQGVLSAFAFKFIERIAVKGIGLVISVILARLLAPKIFGLLAIITVFINLAQSFVTSGLGVALVQNRNTQEDDYSTVFYLSFGIAVIATSILFFCAPLIGNFYNNDALVWPLRVLAFSLLFASLNSVQMAKLQREMRFREMMICNLVATLLSGTMGVVAAFMDMGLWALVIYSLASTVMTTVCLFAVDKWYPKRVFSVSRAKELWGFGWKMLVSSLLCSLYNDVRALIIGKKYSTTDLAYYNKGQQFPDILSNTLDVSIQSVMLPVMSKVQDSKSALNQYLMRSMALATFVVTPVLLGLAAVGNTFFPLLLTEKWNQSIPLLIVFCFSYLFIPIRSANLSLIKASGRSDLYMKIEAIRRAVMLAILLVSIFCFRSVMVIALGFFVSSVVDTCIVVACVKKQTGLGLLRQFGKLWKIFLSGFVMAAIVYLMNSLSMVPIFRLVLQVTIGAAIYIACSFMFRLEPFFYGLDLLKKLFHKK